MSKLNINSKKGFTIIEVTLVLAIAGLIFMMVFTALPALQRSQRDTQRSNDLSRASTALNNYQANNRGKIPVASSGTAYIKGHTEKSGAGSHGDWLYFYDDYLLVGSAGQTDTFADPDGNAYSLWIQKCEKPTETNGEGQYECKGVQRYTGVTFDDQSAGDISGESNVSGTGVPNSGEAGHSIAIITNATCQGEVIVYSSGARKVAISYKKEGGGTICVNN